ncbi:MAG TPA: transcriptional regulator [Spongiibacteraceae bacterium]|nr:transcriptional regulator [Spongiibacteraceae bacterium]HCS26041.1 transcriptional regulator [Spongiibacteraceae bacterium]|tara:strand:- start:819 stop:1136 length:318 start_codon:yes stop_codon:yes gene_type:complete
MKSLEAVTALAALAQDSRLAIFRALVQSAPEPINPGHLSEALDIPKATLSFHLKELSNAGLISAENEGRHKLYRARLETMNTLIDYLLENCCQGTQCPQPEKPAC